MKRNKGFTLIELLVVIAIIGILSAIVLASLNNARDKGKDAATQSQMASMRAQAELYYTGNNNSYSLVCSSTLDAPTNGFGGTSGPGLLFAAAKSDALGDLTGSIVINPGAAGDFNLVTCNDSAMAWAAEAPMLGSASGAPIMWCVDSTGVSKQLMVNLTNGSTSCGN